MKHGPSPHEVHRIRIAPGIEAHHRKADAEHLKCVRDLQRTHQHDRIVHRLIQMRARIRARDGEASNWELEQIGALLEMRDELEAEMDREGQAYATVE